MLKATLRGFLAHRGRLLMSALAVVLSVAFVAGSLVFSDTVSRTFDRLFASTAADVSVTPRQDLRSPVPTGVVRTLPADLARRVAEVPGVAAVQLDVVVRNATVVDRRNRPVGPATGSPITVRNWEETGRNPLRLASGRPPRGDGEAVLDADTAGRQHVRLGDPLSVQAQPGTFRVRVVGIAAFTTTNPGSALVCLDTPVAQRRLLGSTSRATGISVEAAPGVSDARLKGRVAAAVGTTAYDVRTAGEQAKSAAESLGSFLKIIKYVMLGFAGIAVLVGVFLIVNTYAMLVAQRTRELGLLRALGADRGQVRRSVLTEAALLGLVASAVGLAAGIGLAAGLIRLLGVFGMNLSAAEMTVRWTTPVAACVVGTGVTVVAACLPARRAAAVSPMAALADTEAADVGRPLTLRAVAGAVMGAAGAAALAGCALVSRTATAVWLLGVGVVLTLIATVVAGPLLVRPLIRVLSAAFPALFGPVGRMSRRNALRNPRRTGATAAALMVGLALVTGMSVAGASVTRSVDRQIDRTLGADYIVQNRTFLPFPQQVTDAVRATPGAGTVVRQRLAPIAVRLPDGRRVQTLASAYDRQLDSVAHLRYAAGDTAAALADGHLAMDAGFARRHGVRAGSVLPAEFQGGRRTTLTVAALTDQDQAEGFGVQGGLFMGMSTFTRQVPEAADAALYVNAAPGTSTGQLRAALDKALAPYPAVQVRDQADYKELVHEQIAVLLYLVYALLGLAIVIAVLGVVNTLALSVVERTREIGLLRAIGLARRQLRRMVRLESVVIAVFGAVLGLALGLVWGVCAQRVLALQGVTALAIPWGTVVAVMAGSAVVGVVAAVVPAARASRLNVLAAIAHE
ncbi:MULTISPECIES: ABC transporter permease [Streptomyces]|uniref:FtsX-like permease family protein n=1 Tax=Streptomyces thermoviolaceus subsp. thermoviolaceus TaxID=66860 RepID=A0ABX0YQD8_STRTL|nr:MULTISPECIES: ABC transporter permease [Streptomyces]MCM3262772.1 FtsX-like permease family protein [Streptomyces thermoviolaceus]NJP14801.1 FtsX-like permease family protein [Streptomyces thermoviolaceus subsp. thermoviolaceus]RSS01264.1 FtsX-like permease family protein [Streptomyces sp. WAC00469]WTD50177.1 FtsX-like permease family protein [Streptomyces thermoviolaceus]GGV64735.1 membrane protein [Streptomyces thermoviolaceus subsp. apingens]